jgi:hypothetical protein
MRKNRARWVAWVPTVLIGGMLTFAGVVLYGAIAKVVVYRTESWALPLAGSLAVWAIALGGGGLLLARAVRSLRKVLKEPTSYRRRRKASKRAGQWMALGVLFHPWVAPFAAPVEALALLAVGAVMYLLGVGIALFVRGLEDAV